MRITKSVTVTAAGTTTSSAALPTTQASNRPKYIRVVASTVTGAYIKLGSANTVVADNTGILVTNDAVVLDVYATPYYAVIQNGTGCSLNISVVESL